jgi:hypothetical protein
MKFKVTFIDEFESESFEDCCDELLIYLSQCVDNKDVTAFDLVQLSNNKGE